MGRGRSSPAAEAGATGEHPTAARAAAVAPWFVPLIGVICGLIVWDVSPLLGQLSIGIGLIVGGVFFVAASRVRRLTRWTMHAGLAGAAGIPVALVIAAVAVVAERFAPREQLWLGIAFAVAAAAAWTRAVRRREAEWQARAWINEHEVLNLEAGTYDLTRHFQFAEPEQSATSRLVDRWAPVVGPVLIPIFATFGRRGLGDVRDLFILWFAPAVALLFIPTLAKAVVSYSKLRAYERQVGRDIVNR